MITGYTVVCNCHKFDIGVEGGGGGEAHQIYEKTLRGLCFFIRFSYTIVIVTTVANYC